MKVATGQNYQNAPYQSALTFHQNAPTFFQNKSIWKKYSLWFKEFPLKCRRSLVMMYVKTVFLSFLCILTIINLINLQSMYVMVFCTELVPLIGNKIYIVKNYWHEHNKNLQILSTHCNEKSIQFTGLIRFLLTKDSRTSAKVTDCFKPKMKI
jgi:hypothetical protein